MSNTDPIYARADYSVTGGKLIIYRKKNPTVGLGEEKPYELP